MPRLNLIIRMDPMKIFIKGEPNDGFFDESSLFFPEHPLFLPLCFQDIGSYDKTDLGCYVKRNSKKF